MKLNIIKTCRGREQVPRKEPITHLHASPFWIFLFFLFWPCGSLGSIFFTWWLCFLHSFEQVKIKIVWVMGSALEYMLLSFPLHPEWNHLNRNRAKLMIYLLFVFVLNREIRRDYLRMPTRVQVKGPLLLSSFAFEMQSLIEHGGHHFSSTDWTVSSWNLAISMPQCWGYRYTPLRPVFDVGAGDPHSAYHACAVSSLSIPVSFGSIHLSFPVLLWCGLWLLKVTSSAILAVEPMEKC